MRRLLMAAVAAAALTSLAAWAQEASPVGLWKNIDDKTGKPKALIRITEGDPLTPKPFASQNPTCKKCEGALKDQPIIGMTILSGMKPDGDEFNGGKILDPVNGKLYKSRMTLAEGGKTLNVRGYIGTPMLGRTQVWVREQ